MLEIVSVLDACGVVIRNQRLMLLIPGTEPVTLSLEVS
jgi:hypothetical protein